MFGCVGVRNSSLSPASTLTNGSGAEPPTASHLRPSRVVSGIVAPWMRMKNRSSGGGGVNVCPAGTARAGVATSG